MIIDITNVGNQVAVVDVEEQLTNIKGKLAFAKSDNPLQDPTDIPIDDVILETQITSRYLNSSNGVVATPLYNTSIYTSGVGNVNTPEIENKSNLKDEIVLKPGDRIQYLIKVRLKNGVVSAVNLENNKEIRFSNKIKEIGDSNYVENYNFAYVPISWVAVGVAKTNISTHYNSGGDIEYRIHITNPRPDYSDNNYKIEYNLKGILTSSLPNGNKAPAFEDWSITRTSINENAASKAIKTENGYEIICDILPGGDIEYILTGKTNKAAIGLITDGVTGEGVKLLKPKLDINMSVDKNEYQPGQSLTYTLSIDNKSDNVYAGLPIEFNFNNIKTEIVEGLKAELKEGLAYKNWTVVAKIYDSNGNIIPINEFSNPGFTGTLSGTLPDDFPQNIKAVIDGKSKIEYIVTATINENAVGRIENSAKVGEFGIISDSGSVKKQSQLSIQKTVDQPDYAHGDNTLVFTIKVSNATDAGYAPGIRVEDLLENVKVESISNTNTETINENREPKNFVSPFASWTIDVPTLRGEGTRSLMSASMRSSNLNDIINIPSGGEVEYKIITELSKFGQENKKSIPWSDILSAATITEPDNSVKTATVTVKAKKPNLIISKSSNYTGGSELNYTIAIHNAGNGFANNIEVMDEISKLMPDNSGKLAFLPEWTISATKNP